MRALFADKSVSDDYQGMLTQLDVRTKMMIMVACSIGVIFLKSTVALGGLFVVTAVYVGLLQRFWVVALAYGLIFLMMLSAVACVKIMAIWIPELDDFKLDLFIVPFLRVLVILNTVLVTALSSRIQALLGALKGARLPYYVYLPAAVMIRFIPSFINDARQIRDSIRIKGYSLSPIRVLTKPILTLRLVFVPLVVRALRTSDELGVAAELKGAGYRRGVSFYQARRFALLDALAGGLTLLCLLAATVIEYYGV